LIPRRWLTIFVVAAAFVVSFLLRDAIQRAVILPLAYFWWLLKLYYHAIPQLILWVLLVLTVFVSMFRLIPIKNIFRRTLKIKRKSAAGPIENVALWIKKSPGGVYYKWLVANRLGKLARELLDQRQGRTRKGFTRLSGKGWNPPHEVDAYLESGLNGSFADFPRPRWWAKPTRLDIDPHQVIDYLESEMEMRYDRNRQGS
jgi:hypothetical protein